jgi:acetate kinase
VADQHADPVVVAQLKAAWPLRRALLDARAERQTLAATDADLRRSTEETRANLKALEKNTAAADLRAKLTARLADDSARLDQVGKRIIEVDLKINESQVAFNDAIRAIKLLQPLSLD